MSSPSARSQHENNPVHNLRIITAKVILGCTKTTPQAKVLYKLYLPLLSKRRNLHLLSFSELTNLQQHHGKKTSRCFFIKSSILTFCYNRGSQPFSYHVPLQHSDKPHSFSTDKDVPLQNFDRWACSRKTPYDKIFSHDFSQISLTIYI